jgi:enoyl-CoA hydratase
MIHHEERGATTLITIDRPERRNALDADALDGLLAAITGAQGRVLVLTGAGGHFCAGADLQGVEDERFAAHLRQVLLALRATPVPVIAAVERSALGAGTQLAIASDLRVATPDARFGVPAGKLGLMVDQWTIRRLAAIVGQGPSAAILLAAEQVGAEHALALGLVQRIGTLDEALAWADEIAALAPLTLAGHKLGLRLVEDEAETDPAYAAAFTRAWSSADLQEGIAAFRERRTPTFDGR